MQNCPRWDKIGPMPITKGAKKTLRAATRKRVFNIRRQRELVGSVKEVKKLIGEGKKENAREALSRAYKAIDKAVKRGLIKKNTASRKKSRLSAAIQKS